jgi:hypothetical protein
MATRRSSRRARTTSRYETVATVANRITALYCFTFTA